MEYLVYNFLHTRYLSTEANISVPYVIHMDKGLMWIFKVLKVSGILVFELHSAIGS